ncbi:hypothetical protein CCYN74_210075 [Capnocytophaga cynodegmi]|uniref:Uncharacterized protein n=1 Tax=Capnocytophaga cynodegmi TaxID=28189 RepID=A0A0B7HIB8_9FLAO|nr:hypothetical protein CCYN74_210075 [Capnocytophaga cynodegmi]
MLKYYKTNDYSITNVTKKGNYVTNTIENGFKNEKHYIVIYFRIT